MKVQTALCLLLATCFAWTTSSFCFSYTTKHQKRHSGASSALVPSALVLAQSPLDRRQFGNAVWGAAGAFAASAIQQHPANAQVFFDPAQYGDQELRVSAVDTVKESVRRAILREPALAPSFYQLAVLDALSFDAETSNFGPNGGVMYLVLSTKATDTYTENLKKTALALIDTASNLKKLSAISLADAVAIGGAEAIESIGGPYLPVQLGRADTPSNVPINPDLPLNLLSGACSPAVVQKAFMRAGLTEREMT
jgi:hypothetical protein